MKLGIAIPTYNEAGNISKLIKSIYAQLGNLPNLQTTLLIIDDDSPDGTAKIIKKLVKELSTKKFQIELLSRHTKDGLGRAYIAGFNKLIGYDLDFILQMDADLSHDPVYIPKFIKAASNSDLIIGSRYVKGGATPDWSFSRKIMSKCGNIYAKTILGSQITDYTGGFNMYSVGVMQAVNPNTIQSYGYGFLIDLKFHALQKSRHVVQIPIVFHDRTHGKSKLPKSTILKNIILVPRIRFRNN